jgi:hypothetical protein
MLFVLILICNECFVRENSFMYVCMYVCWEWRNYKSFTWIVQEVFIIYEFCSLAWRGD